MSKASSMMGFITLTLMFSAPGFFYFFLGLAFMNKNDQPDLLHVLWTYSFVAIPLMTIGIWTYFAANQKEPSEKIQALMASAPLFYFFIWFLPSFFKLYF